MAELSSPDAVSGVGFLLRAQQFFVSMLLFCPFCLFCGAVDMLRFENISMHALGADCFYLRQIDSSATGLRVFLKNI